MGKYITVSVNEDISVNVDKIIKQIDTQYLVEELITRKESRSVIDNDQFPTAEEIIDWFNNPFISEYDKNLVKEKLR